MKTEGTRGNDGFIHDDDCLSGNGAGSVSGTGPCTCSILTKDDKIRPLTGSLIYDADIDSEPVFVPLCSYCRQHHDGECPWKQKK